MNIILADHHSDALFGLNVLIQEQPGFVLAGEAQNAQDLLGLAETKIPDLVLLDEKLPGMPIEELVARLHALEPQPVVVVMSSDNERGRMILKAGADAFVSKAEDAYWLVELLNKYSNQIQRKKEAKREEKE